VKLRAKLFVAQLPLIGALLVSGIAGGLFLRSLGASAQNILQDNYRSILAAQRMKESAERIDSAVLFWLLDERGSARELLDANRRRFSEELAVQQRNLTEPGEAERTVRLTQDWALYLAQVDAFVAEPDATRLRGLYFEQLLPAFSDLKEATEAVLVMNQDAILAKSERARALADRSFVLLLVVCSSGLVVALYAGAAITRRVLRPLAVLGHATRRIGEGDLTARARVEGRDEVGELARDFNAMADHLQKYRQSTLGELLTAQRVSQATIDSLPDPVLVAAVGGEILHANRAAETVLRVSVERGLAPLEPAIRAVVDRVLQQSAEGRGGYVPKGLDEAVAVSTPEGERHFLPRATPLYAEEGGVVGSTVVLQDVTRLLRVEELRNDVVATVAHEFRTPLTSLRMAIHLLLEERIGALNAKQADLAHAAREDCERLQATVDELLDLSRIQSGRMVLHVRTADVEALVSDAVESQRVVASDRRVILRSEVLPGSGTVNADVERVQIVLGNLLQNAIRHSPPGESVLVRVARVEGGLRFLVIDRGAGVPAEHQATLFEKYFQVPGHGRGGAGLGLFIAREIVRAHGGEIGVESLPGQGSTFWFELPRADPALLPIPSRG
jgi:two-component system, NtrC family, sensor histidine kinase KinB